MILILTGPPGAGKNTISSVFARHGKKCAVIDVDLIRWIILQPHKAPWEGEEGHKQQLLGVRHACMLAKSLISENYDVLILDVISDETAQIYKGTLKDSQPKIVLLLPSFEEIKRRNKIRPPRLKEEQIKMLYKQQKSLTKYDLKIDNTNLSAEEVVSKMKR